MVGDSGTEKIKMLCFVASSLKSKTGELMRHKTGWGHRKLSPADVNISIDPILEELQSPENKSLLLREVVQELAFANSPVSSS